MNIGTPAARFDSYWRASMCAVYFGVLNIGVLSGYFHL